MSLVVAAAFAGCGTDAPVVLEDAGASSDATVLGDGSGDGEPVGDGSGDGDSVGDGLGLGDGEGTGVSGPIV